MITDYQCPLCEKTLYREDFLKNTFYSCKRCCKYELLAKNNLNIFCDTIYVGCFKIVRYLNSSCVFMYNFKTNIHIRDYHDPLIEFELKEILSVNITESRLKKIIAFL